jgi:hypothetical protein
MTLLINPNKVKRQLKIGKPLYLVSSYSVPTRNIPCAPPTADVHGTVAAISPDVERARERMLTLRQNIIDGGRAPLSPDALEQEIDETRGRL